MQVVSAVQSTKSVRFEEGISGGKPVTKTERKKKLKGKKHRKKTITDEEKASIKQFLRGGAKGDKALSLAPKKYCFELAGVSSVEELESAFDDSSDVHSALPHFILGWLTEYKGSSVASSSVFDGISDTASGEGGTMSYSTSDKKADSEASLAGLKISGETSEVSHLTVESNLVSDLRDLLSFIDESLKETFTRTGGSNVDELIAKIRDDKNIHSSHNKTQVLAELDEKSNKDKVKLLELAIKALTELQSLEDSSHRGGGTASLSPLIFF